MRRLLGPDTPRRRLALLLAVAVHIVAILVVREGPVQRRPVDNPARIAWAPSSPSPSTPITIDVRVTPPPADESPAPAELPPSVQTPVQPTSSLPTPSASSSPTSLPLSSASPPSVLSSSSPPSPLPSSNAGATADLAPRPENIANLPAAYAPGDRSIGRLVRGLDATALKGPVQGVESLRGALDFQTDKDADHGKSGAVLAASKARRALQADLAFHDVTVGMASDWFRDVRNGSERGFRPTASDLDNPGEVTQAAIFANLARDPTAWDDEAKRVLGPMLRATSLHSQDPIKRLALGNSATLGESANSQLRATTLQDLLSRKEAGLSVRFAFEVDVHHDGVGGVTAIDVLRKETEKALQEKIRLAIEDAVRTAPPAPTLINGGRPFRSRWLFAATWFIDPPGCLAMPSDAMGAIPGVPQVGCGGTFDVTSDGVKTSSFEVQQKVTAELLRIIPLGPG